MLKDEDGTCVVQELIRVAQLKTRACCILAIRFWKWRKRAKSLWMW
jgi:hypothetical protein